MTVEAQEPIISYAGNGTAAPLAVPFRFLENDHLRVTRIAADRVETVLTRGADFSVTGAGSDQGGTVVPLASVPIGITWLIERVSPREQPTAYADGFYSAETHERALDRGALIAQEMDRDLGDTRTRAMLVPRGETGGDLEPLLTRQGKVAVFTADGGMAGVQSFGFVGGDTADDGLWQSEDVPINDGVWG